MEAVMYPKNDNHFEDIILEGARKLKGGWELRWDTALCFYLAGKVPLKPKPGMKCRMYGKGLGSRIRGVFLNGKKVYYRTEAEDKTQAEIELYGRDAKDWLKRWDAGQSVWTIEMGGLGPGYEQCIHITAAEILRLMLKKKYDHSKWNEKETWKPVGEEIDKIVMKVPVVKNLGLSGAQWGAALNVAANLYRRGPREIMKDKAIENRKIQVERSFP